MLAYICKQKINTLKAQFWVKAFESCEKFSFYSKKLVFKEETIEFTTT